MTAAPRVPTDAVGNQARRARRATCVDAVLGVSAMAGDPFDELVVLADALLRRLAVIQCDLPERRLARFIVGERLGGWVSPFWNQVALDNYQIASWGGEPGCEIDMSDVPVSPPRH